MSSNPPHTDAERKVIWLNQMQLAVALIVLVGGVIGSGLAYAKGWLGLPEKVNDNAKAVQALADLPPRVTKLESDQVELWKKRSDDHDLLLKMSQSMDDIKQQSLETRQDIKDLRGHAVVTSR